jgi:hypothetical protein
MRASLREPWVRAERPRDRGRSPAIGRSLLAIATLIWAVAACGGGGTIAPSTSPSPSAQASGGDGIDDGLPPELADAIMVDLEARIGVDVSSATVVSAERATWPNGAMGCPKPGEVYIQVIVEGYQVMVEFDGAVYDYRVSDSGAVRLCSVM